MKNKALRSMIRHSWVFAAVMGMGTLPAAASGPDPANPYVESISYGGSGCAQGTVGSSFSDDRLHFTLIFDSFVASTGPGVPITESRKNCQLSVNVHVPDGSAAACMKLAYRGYVQVPGGTGGTQQVVYSVAGRPVDNQATSYPGPVAKDYLNTDDAMLPYAGGAGARTLGANGQVHIDVPGYQAQITTDSIDGSVGACALQDCMDGGWERFGFRNQGQCIRAVNTGKDSR